MTEQYPWQQLEKRKLDQIGQNIQMLSLAALKADEQKYLTNTSLILNSPTDMGVCRNGGRRGTAFAPDALLCCLKKMSDQSNIPKTLVMQISQEAEERASFVESQRQSSARTEYILGRLPKLQKLIHLGGGHDHIYPLMSAFSRLDFTKPIHVINIDAHLDTRTDVLPHSGTPFRQFAQVSKLPFFLTQFGIHNFSNHSSNYSSLANEAKMNIYGVDELECLTQSFTKPLEANFLELTLGKINPHWKQSQLIISLDCDGLDASFMEAVSAVNHQGLPLKFVKQLISLVKASVQQQLSILGVYEYNPVYEGLSQKGARAISSLLHEFLK